LRADRIDSPAQVLLRRVDGQGMKASERTWDPHAYAALDGDLPTVPAVRPDDPDRRTRMLPTWEAPRGDDGQPVDVRIPRGRALPHDLVAYAAFLNLPAEEISIRIQDVASAACGARVVVRVGEEAHGYRNVGVDLPVLRGRVRAALEAVGVPLAETAIAPKVGGDICGSVQLRETGLASSAHLAVCSPVPPSPLPAPARPS
jgi:hypothetical protein